MGLTMRVRALLMRLEDFRLLPLFVALSMAAGVAIGSVLSISDFALTPPIDALKSIAGGTFDPTEANALSLGVPIGLFAMMYPAMTNVRLGEVGNALRSPRQLAVVLVFNYLVAPFLMLGLANVFVSDPELHTGLVLYGLAPCIAMVIIFTFLAKGNTPMALVFVALNAVVQMALIPVYARLLIGNLSFDVGAVFESVVLYTGLPLPAGALTRMGGARRAAGGGGRGGGWGGLPGRSCRGPDSTCPRPTSPGRWTPRPSCRTARGGASCACSATAHPPSARWQPRPGG